MTLKEWFKATKTRHDEFARRIGVSRVTLFRFKTDKRVPDRRTMELINSETDGAVAPNDFFQIGQTTPAPHADEVAG